MSIYFGLYLFFAVELLTQHMTLYMYITVDQIAILEAEVKLGRGTYFYLFIFYICM